MQPSVEKESFGVELALLIKAVSWIIVHLSIGLEEASLGYTMEEYAQWVKRWISKTLSVSDIYMYSYAPISAMQYVT